MKDQGCMISFSIPSHKSFSGSDTLEKKKSNAPLQQKFHPRKVSGNTDSSVKPFKIAKGSANQRNHF